MHSLLRTALLQRQYESRVEQGLTKFFTEKFGSLNKNFVTLQGCSETNVSDEAHKDIEIIAIDKEVVQESKQSDPVTFRPSEAQKPAGTNGLLRTEKEKKQNN